MKNIDKILIPSGPNKRIDLQRARGAIKIYGPQSKYALLGAGPDTLEALKYGTSEIPRSLDHHVGLYRFVMSKIPQENIEIIDKSKTTVENLVEFFKDDRQGNYIIVSDEWQLSKYIRVFDILKNKNYISSFASLEGNAIITEDYYNFIQKIASEIKTNLELLRL